MKSLSVAIEMKPLGHFCPWHKMQLWINSNCIFQDQFQVYLFFWWSSTIISLLLWTYVWPKLPITTLKYKNLFSRLQNNCSFTPQFLLYSLQFYVKNPWMKFLDVAILMKPLQSYNCDWLNTNARQEMATSTISLRNNFYRRNIKSTGTLPHGLCILQTTINDLL